MRPDVKENDDKGWCSQESGDEKRQTIVLNGPGLPSFRLSGTHI